MLEKINDIFPKLVLAKWGCRKKAFNPSNFLLSISSATYINPSKPNKRVNQQNTNMC